MSQPLPAEVIENLAGWKASYGEVFLLPASELTLVYRGLSFAEVDTYNERVKHDPVWAEEEALRACLLYPPDLNIDDLPAQAVQKILQHINECSGIGSLDEFEAHVAKGREYAASIEGFAVSFVAHAFHISPMEIRKMTVPVLARYVAMAEQVLRTQFSFSAPDKKSKRRGWTPPIDEQKQISSQMLGAQQSAAHARQKQRSMSMEDRVRAARTQMGNQAGQPPMQIPPSPDPRSQPASNIDFSGDNALFQDAGFR